MPHTALPPGLQALELPVLPPRPRESHKGDHGTVLVVAGSRRYPGAAILAALGAGRAGAGLVQVALPSSLVSCVVPAVPFATVLPCAETPDGGFAMAAADDLRAAAAKAGAVVLGPGLGLEADTGRLLARLLRDVHKPLVLDADALNLLASMGEDPFSARRAATNAPTVLTPHPGEFARLTGLAKPQGADRAVQAARYAAQHKLVVVLKGAGTVVTDGRRAWIEPAGNPGMATGGMGDVLAGALGALLAVPQRFDDAAAAAALAVHAHALAGDRAAHDLGQTGVLPEDVARRLGKALEQAR
ncbi:MAG: NAD(P)H-hydrate dehydratase [Planctomycetota bacterium]